MLSDVKQAYFHAKASRELYVELPHEDPFWSADEVGRLNRALHGTRDAAINGAQAYSEVLQKMWLAKGSSSPCSFYHKELAIRTVVHGGDFMSEGPGENLKLMDAEMRKSFALKTEILGGDKGDVQSLRVLNRQIIWKDNEIHWEADPRHVEILARQLGMEHSSPVKTPGDRNDADKTFRYRDVDGEEEPREEETALHVDDLFRRQSGASPGRSLSSPLMREDHPKLARWADLEADEDAPDMSEEMTATRESRRRAALSADGWSEGRDSLWR